MRAHKPTNTIFAALLLSSAGGVFANDLSSRLQPPPPPACAAPRAWQLAPAPMARKRVHANAVGFGNDSTFYVQMGGGSIVPFLLLGPLGSAISGEAVKQRAKDQAAAIDKTKVVDPRAILAELLSLRPAPPPDAQPMAPVVVEPFVVYVRPKGSDMVERRLVLEIACDGWLGWYTDHLSAVPNQALNQAPTDADLAALDKELHDGATDLIELFAADSTAPPTDIRAMEVRSWQLNPYFHAGLPQGVRGLFKGRQVIVGQGDARSDKFMLLFMKGVHLMDPARIEIGKPW